MNQEDLKLGIIGLGYVGLPLAVEFGNLRYVVGFDINKNRIEELKKSFDRTHELSAKALSKAKGLSYSCDIEDLAECNCYIITVPTPIE